MDSKKTLLQIIGPTEVVFEMTEVGSVEPDSDAVYRNIPANQVVKHRTG